MRLADFAGIWDLRRRVEPDVGPAAVFEGRAVVEPDGAGLVWREAGTLRLAGRAPMPATRVYLWREAPGGVAVLFEDGRPFHHIDLRSACPEAEHICDRDLYRVRYDLARWPDWRATWRVDGPAKAYRMETEHRRPALARGPALWHVAGRAREDTHDP